MDRQTYLTLSYVYVLHTCYVVKHLFHREEFNYLPHLILTTLMAGGAMGSTLDLRPIGCVAGSNDPTRPSGQCCLTTLGKLFTPMCLCHQAV